RPIRARHSGGIGRPAGAGGDRASRGPRGPDRVRHTGVVRRRRWARNPGPGDGHRGRAALTRRGQRRRTVRWTPRILALPGIGPLGIAAVPAPGTTAGRRAFARVTSLCGVVCGDAVLWL